MGKSIRSKRMRHFRAIKRTHNEVIEHKKLLEVCAKLGTYQGPLEEPEPKRFSHAAPKDEKDEEKNLQDPNVSVYLSREKETEEWEQRTAQKLKEQEQQQLQRKEHRKKMKAKKRKTNENVDMTEATPGEAENQQDNSMEQDENVNSLLKKKVKNSSTIKKRPKKVAPKSRMNKGKSRKNL